MLPSMLKLILHSLNLAKHWDGLDGVVHSIGFAPAHTLDGDFTDITDREGFKIAHDISAYSFIAMARAAKPLLQAAPRLPTNA